MHRALAGMEKGVVHEFVGIGSKPREAGGKGKVSGTPPANRKYEAEHIEKKDKSPFRPRGREQDVNTGIAL